MCRKPVSSTFADSIGAGVERAACVGPGGATGGRVGGSESWLVGWLAGWLVGWLDGWVVGVWVDVGDADRVTVGRGVSSAATSAVARAIGVGTISGWAGRISDLTTGRKNAG